MPIKLDQDWTALRAGDHSALERLYRQHAPDLLRYATSIAGADNAADALHDLFVQLWQRRAHLNPDVNVRAYLLVSLRNAVLKSLRREASVDDSLPTFASEEHQEFLIIQAEQASASSARLSAAVQQLSSREQELVELKILQGLEYEQVCEITGISYQSARNVLTRAIGKLRQNLLPIFIFAMGTNASIFTLLLERTPFALT